MPALPTMTPEVRAAALAKSSVARTRRSEVKQQLKRGTTTLTAVLRDAAADEALAKMKVSALVEAMPGVGKIRRVQIMDRLGIAENRRVRGLGPVQRQALEQEFAA